MNFTKKLVSICLSSICFCPDICAMKSSISTSEGLYRCSRISTGDEDKDELKNIDTSPYSLEKQCNRIIVGAEYTSTNTIIINTMRLCAITFERISGILCSSVGLSKRYCTSCLLNYAPLIERLNYILLDIIQHKLKASGPYYPIYGATKRNIIIANSAVSFALEQYRNIFGQELKAVFLEPTQAQQLYDLFRDTQEGISYAYDFADLSE